MHPATGQSVRTDFVQVTLVDPRGRVLMQERDEHAPVWPDMWCFPGGGLEAGEQPVAGAVRELAEETGVVVAAEDLTDLGQFELATERGIFHFHTYVARTTLSDRDVECHEGRQMVFVDPDPLPDFDLVPSTALVAPHLHRWIDEHPYVPAAGHTASPAPSWSTGGAGSSCRSATSTPASTRRSGAWPAGTSTRERTSSRRPTGSSRRRPAYASRRAH